MNKHEEFLQDHAAVAILDGLLETGEKLTAAADEIKRLEAIVERLPKTADGVPVVPGMRLWQLETTDAGKTWKIVEHLADKVFWPYAGWIQRRCYPTRGKAAEAAKEIP